MTTKDYLENMRSIHTSLLDYIDYEDNIEEKYENLKSVLNNYKICEKKNEFKLFLHLLLKISNNHKHTVDFYAKIEKIILLIKDDITKFFPNNDIFSIFKNNKRILLSLIKNEIFIFDHSIVKTITSGKYKARHYPQYFITEIKELIAEKTAESILKTIPENFEEKRLIGENDNHICELIRNDSIEEFISYFTQNKNQLSKGIPSSIFETSPYLLKRKVSLLAYASYCGSPQILKYLFQNTYKYSSDLSPLLYTYAVHCCNLEIFQILEESKIELKTASIRKCFKESIKCHHNNIHHYILNNYVKNEIDDINDLVLLQSIQNYNFIYMNDASINQSVLVDLCKYGYTSLVEILLKSQDININAIFIYLEMFK